jgi:hypothetical protein
MVTSPNTFLHKLNQPYPYANRIGDSLKNILLISIFVFAFVFIFRSTEMTENGPTGQRLLYAFYFGALTLAVACFNLWILSWFSTNRMEQDWKVKHEIALYLLQFGTIAIAIFLLSDYLMGGRLGVSEFFWSILSALVVGGIPVVFLVISEQNKLLKKHLAEASQINAGEPFSKRETEEALLQINEVSIPLADILYAESDRNYINLVLTRSRRERIRSTVKEFGRLVAPNPNLIRCHRAYYVNTQYIETVSGNAQGLTLTLAGTETRVPVSRSYIPVLKELSL